MNFKILRATLPAIVAVFALVALTATPASAAPTIIYVGTEDICSCSADNDYNDMIFSLMGEGLELKGSSGYDWQPMVIPNEDGSPYWDGNSDDSTQAATIGNWILATEYFGGTGLGAPIGNILYWGDGAGGNDPSVSFFSTGGIATDLYIEVAGYSAQNKLSWAPAATPWLTSLIFDGSDGSGASASFNPGGEDFVLFANGPGGDFYSHLHGDQFAYFSEVPEPGTMALLGSGLIGLGFVARRRQKPGGIQRE